MTVHQLHVETAALEPESRSKRLRAATHGTHETLDERIMAADPFASRVSYAQFLKVQFDFHVGLEVFYHDGEIASLIPDIRSRRRLDLIHRDLIDIGAHTSRIPPVPDYLIDVPVGLGWLYVAEGSNLGAAFLLKEARKLNLSESFGARHLAASSEGRGLHWRRFTAALDAVTLHEEEEKRVIEGARQAFQRVRSLVEHAFYPQR